MIPDMFQIVITGLMLLVPVCLIYRKAGLSPLWGFLVFLPGFGLLLVFVQLAYTTWPNHVDSQEKP